jgi:signal transduction histidine kinase/CheY-like chemotaxis protein/HAMP domain-containing protein
VTATFLRGRPIQQKLLRIIALALVFGLLLAAVAVLVYDTSTVAPRRERDAQAQSTLMRTITAPALVFDDSTAANQNLATLRARPEVASATLYQPDGRIEGRYVRPGVTPPARPATFTQRKERIGGRLYLLDPVVQDDGRVVGWLSITYDMRPLRYRVGQYGLIAIVVILALFAAGLVLLRVLERTVTDPLRKLSDAAHDIERTGDMRVRVPPGESDEIGAMSRAFNRMLTRLEDQQATLQTSEARLRLALDAATMQPWTLEPGPAALAALEAGVHPDDRERVRAEVLRALEEDGLDVEFRAAGTGEERWTALRGQAQHGPGGEVVRLVGVAQDVTRRRRLELQLIQSQKMEAIGTLAGGIAHDFNNLLTGMIGYMGFAERALPHGSPIRDDIEQAEKAARRAGELTTRLLGYARRQMVVPSPLDLNRAVTAVEPLLRRILGEHISIVTELATDLWQTKVDGAQLEQVLINLAVNARDSMPDGGTLRFATRNRMVDARTAAREPELSAGAYVVVDVADSGVGMDSATVARIFEPFFTTKPVGQGTGLGLAMCFGIVKQAGGHILVDTAPGRGSCFSVLLPRLDATARVGDATPHEAPGELERGSEVVLVVEDDATVRELAVRTLRAAGYGVREAAGAAAAREMMSAAVRLDLVLTDMVMPGEGGPAVADEARRVHPGARVLYMSGYASDVLGERGVLTAEIPFLAKPFTPAGLARAVRAALDGRTGGA